MSQENVELVYRASDAFNRRDYEAFFAISDPDGEFSPRAMELEGGSPLRGQDAIRRWMEDLFRLAPDFRGEVEDVRDLGDMTIARTRFSGHGVASDVPFEQTSWTVTEWRNGKGTRSRVFGSEAEALEAAGLSE
jgi:ketosteroid isomerase-like protein